MSTFRAILAASRPISWVNTAFPFAAAYLVLGHGIDWLLVVGTLFFLLPYNIAMYGINDVFDYESDIRNPRKGGVEGAVLSKDLHRPLLMAAAWSTLPFLVVLFAAGTWISALWLALSVFAVIAYSAPPWRFKERPLVDSLTSSAHFVTPALVGASIRAGEINLGVYVAIGAFFLWGAASHALGAVQDVRADRAGGLQSIATSLGARSTTRLTVFLYLGATGLLFLLPAPGWVIGFISLGYVLNAARLWNIDDETCEKANRAWRVFLWLNYLVGAVVTIVLASVFLPPAGA